MSEQVWHQNGAHYYYIIYIIITLIFRFYPGNIFLQKFHG